MNILQALKPTSKCMYFYTTKQALKTDWKWLFPVATPDYFCWVGVGYSINVPSRIYKSYIFFLQMMFLEKVFEAHFFLFQSCKIVHFLHAADQKTLKYDTDCCIPKALSRLGNTWPCFPKHRWKEGSLLFTNI